MNPISVPVKSIHALLLREVATTHGKTGIGYFWALLEPVFSIGLLCLTMAIVFNLPPLGDSFPLFYATGVLPFMMVLEMTQRMGIALRAARPLLMYPRVRFLDAILARFLLGVLNHAVLWGVVLTALGAEFSAAVPLTGVFSLCALLAFGLGMGHAWMTTVWQSWPLIWSILTRPMFLVSGVFFLVEELSEPVQKLVFANPVAHLIVAMRRAVFSGYDAGQSAVFVALTALILAVCGLAGLGISHQKSLEEAA